MFQPVSHLKLSWAAVTHVLTPVQYIVINILQCLVHDNAASTIILNLVTYCQWWYVTKVDIQKTVSIG